MIGKLLGGCHSIGKVITYVSCYLSKVGFFYWQFIEFIEKLTQRPNCYYYFWLSNPFPLFHFIEHRHTKTQTLKFNKFNITEIICLRDINFGNKTEHFFLDFDPNQILLLLFDRSCYNFIRVCLEFLSGIDLNWRWLTCYQFIYKLKRKKNKVCVFVSHPSAP